MWHWLGPVGVGSLLCSGFCLGLKRLGSGGTCRYCGGYPAYAYGNAYRDLRRTGWDLRGAETAFADRKSHSAQTKDPPAGRSHQRPGQSDPEKGVTVSGRTSLHTHCGRPQTVHDPPV